MIQLVITIEQLPNGAVHMKCEGGTPKGMITTAGEREAVLEDIEWFKVWSLLAKRLADSETLERKKKDLCLRSFESISNRIERDLDSITPAFEKGKFDNNRHIGGVSSSGPMGLWGFSWRIRTKAIRIRLSKKIIGVAKKERDLCGSQNS